MHHQDVYRAKNKKVALQKRQQEIISLYHSIKENGYNGSPILAWFDKDGYIHLYDGFTRIAIMSHLGMNDYVNVETNWEGIQDGADIGKDYPKVGRDFPLVETLMNESPAGTMLYQPVDDYRLRGWKLDRPDSPKRLEYIKKNLTGKTVLDIGCSEGYFSRELAKAGCKVTAIDRSKGLIAAARYLSIINSLDIDYQVSEWEDALNQNGSFDNILFLSVLHNDMKNIGVEKGLEKLQSFRDKAKRIFLEVPNNINERQWMRDGYPKFNFHTSGKILEHNTGMAIKDRWHNLRSIFLMQGNGHKVKSKRIFGSISKEAIIYEPDVNGYPMYLFKDEKWITPAILKNHVYEALTTSLFKQYVNDGDTVVDAGANFGYYTVLASKLVGKNGKVYAFEPARENFKLLQANIELNDCKNVVAFQKALSNKKTRTKLFKPELTSYGEQYLQEVLQEQGKVGWERYDTKELLGSNKSKVIDVVRLDEVLVEAPNVIKIDVEGAERLVLEGMDSMLNKTETIFVEDTTGVSKWLTSDFGFEVIKLQPQKYELNNVLLSKISKTMPLKVQLKQAGRPVAVVASRPDHLRLHVLGVAHSKTNKDHFLCPFTELTYGMCQMMTDLGHEVYHYGAEGSDVPCTEDIVVLSDATQHEAYGDFDWHKHYWNYRGGDLAYTTFAKNAVEEINRRKGPRDMLLTVSGKHHKGIADAVDLMTVEYAIGYEGVFSKFRVFASYAWMHYIYGLLGSKIDPKKLQNGSINGQWYDAVIPHYFNPDDFEYREKKEDYFLYIGRLIPRKGPHIAAQTCERIGAKLVVAGQGDPKSCGLDKPYVEYIGTVGVKERSELMGKAKAVFTPTIYIEPFNMCTVEAMLCGTPVISTDWGSFTEIVEHGEVGYRCRTMDDFVWAAKNIDKIKPDKCRKYAIDNYSLDRVSKMYQEYFTKIQDLSRDGWYTKHPERKNLDWLNRSY